jgi:hypothetical protein
MMLKDNRVILAKELQLRADAAHAGFLHLSELRVGHDG